MRRSFTSYARNAVGKLGRPGVKYDPSGVFGGSICIRKQRGVYAVGRHGGKISQEEYQIHTKLAILNRIRPCSACHFYSIKMTFIA